VRISRASLQVLAGYAETFTPHGPIGQWQGGEKNAAGVIQMPWYEYQPEIDRFVEDMYAAKLVRPVDWQGWAGTPEAQQLIEDPAAIASASHDDLIYLLTTILRGERFSDGEIAAAYERGTLLAIAQRAQVLLDGGSGKA
jgi:hypothetical protein